MREYRPHRLVIPFTALLAVVLTVVLFKTLDGRMSSEHAVYVAAFVSFSVTALIGLVFKPLLGE
jgi:predicted neutral ceramidase superfamily lipid hydrolase